MGVMKAFSALCVQAVRNLHPLVEVGTVCCLVAQAAGFYVIGTTSAPLWNGPQHGAEQKAVLAGQVLGFALFTAGWGLQLRREARAAREAVAKHKRDGGAAS